MPRPAPGEIWRIDLGLTAKVRPCLLMSDYPGGGRARVDVSNSTHYSDAAKPVGVCLRETFSQTRRLSSATNPACIAKSVGDEARCFDQ
jgi:hypothetical protein